ncbi:MAG: hypothetical protein UV40_C0017G0007 [Parcubacteria group bacterium GW2011_GWA1_42_7]|nr:MAG: hypothetical protein UV40_C0017G0007 [Parcubacteria group bacterium GW2011_GWA1_42_7]
MEKYPLIRKIYLYLFTIVGLSLIVIGAVKLIDLGLKMTVFKQADSQQYSYQKMPLSAPISEQKLDNIVSGQGNAQLTEEEKAQIQRWLADYKAWQETQSKIDPLTSDRQRQASNAIAMIIVGLPLYLYHWRIIKKETKEA